MFPSHHLYSPTNNLLKFILTHTTKIYLQQLPHILKNTYLTLRQPQPQPQTRKSSLQRTNYPVMTSLNLQLYYINKHSITPTYHHKTCDLNNTLYDPFIYQQIVCIVPRLQNTFLYKVKRGQSIFIKKKLRGLEQLIIYQQYPINLTGNICIITPLKLQHHHTIITRKR